MADPIGDDETFARGVEKARAALGRPRPVRPVPEEPEDAEGPALDDRDGRIAELEAENRRLRRTLDRVRKALDP